MTKGPGVILFDLGGVLVENRAAQALTKLVPEPLDESRLRERWQRSSSIRDFERGDIPPAEFATRFVAEWGIQMSEESFLGQFEEWPAGPYHGVEPMLTRLRETRHVACLSNCNELHWKRFGAFLDCFDDAFSSHLLGAVKPEFRAYDAVIRALGCPPADILFFDDSAANVHAAQCLGMRALQVDGFAAVRDVLEAEGIVPA
jgi:putative hydrolase of the HAD superfamily